MRRAAFVFGALAALALAAALCAAHAGGDGANGAARADFLQQEYDAAKGQKFYLVLDPAARALELRVLGVTLKRFPLERALIGVSRLRGGGTPQWPALAFTLASEVDEPDRPVITPPTAGQEQASVQAASGAAPAATDGESTDDGSAAAKPASLAESLSSFRERTYAGIPPVFRLHFEPALDVVIRGEPPAQDLRSRLRRTWFQLEEGWTGFRHWLKGEPIATRVTLFMTPDDARRLYLALDPAIQLLIEPAGAGGPSGG
ncbi:MAG: hypothetical protein MUE47_06705 [Acidobacteria bacterium]|jgi:hypothetical protein|nr:hypothetical protein [Acidobacteriota bacterium]